MPREPVREFRRACCALTASVMLGLGVALPVLERADFVHEPVVESEHNPATCPPGHDHTVCTQVGASFSAPADPPHHGPTPGLVRTPLPTATSTAVSWWLIEAHHSRAPPSA